MVFLIKSMVFVPIFSPVKTEMFRSTSKTSINMFQLLAVIYDDEGLVFIVIPIHTITDLTISTLAFIKS